ERDGRGRSGEHADVQPDDAAYGGGDQRFDGGVYVDAGVGSGGVVLVRGAGDGQREPGVVGEPDGERDGDDGTAGGVGRGVDEEEEGGVRPSDACDGPCGLPAAGGSGRDADRLCEREGGGSGPSVHRRGRRDGVVARDRAVDVGWAVVRVGEGAEGGQVVDDGLHL